MNGRSRSSLFLIEQLIVITAFALCSAVCVQISAESFLMAHGTRDMNHALAAAKSGAECYKVYGDPAKTAAVLSGRAPVGENEGTVYYDAEWRSCGEAEAAYMLRLEPLRAEGAENAEKTAALPLLCELSVEKITGEKLVGFTVAAGRQRRAENGGRNE